MSCNTCDCESVNCCCPEITINEVTDQTQILIQETPQEISVIVNEQNPNALNLGIILASLSSNNNFIKELSGNYNFINQSTNIFSSYSSKFIETADEMDIYVQPLTSKWIETAEEMDTLQIAPTAHWQGVYEYIEAGVVDAGYF